MSRRQFRKTQVFLNIYDLHDANSWAHTFGMGAYHSGIEIFGKEYSYGHHHQGGTGIFDCRPKQAFGAIFRESRLAGEVSLSQDEFQRILHRLQVKWVANEYHILYRNCNHFSRALLQELGLSMPGYINRLATVAQCFACCLPSYMQKPPPPSQLQHSHSSSSSSSSSHDVARTYMHMRAEPNSNRSSYRGTTGTSSSSSFSSSNPKSREASTDKFLTNFHHTNGSSTSSSSSSSSLSSSSSSSSNKSKPSDASALEIMRQARLAKLTGNISSPSNTGHSPAVSGATSNSSLSSAGSMHSVGSMQSTGSMHSTGSIHSANTTTLSTNSNSATENSSTSDIDNIIMNNNNNDNECKKEEIIIETNKQLKHSSIHDYLDDIIEHGYSMFNMNTQPSSSSNQTIISTSTATDGTTTDATAPTTSQTTIIPPHAVVDNVHDNDNQHCSNIDHDTSHDNNNNNNNIYKNNIQLQLQNNNDNIDDNNDDNDNTNDNNDILEKETLVNNNHNNTHQLSLTDIHIKDIDHTTSNHTNDSHTLLEIREGGNGETDTSTLLSQTPHRSDLTSPSHPWK